MNNNNFKNEKNNLQQNQPNSKENDFFSQLQKKEKKHGNKTRGGGHGWKTFIEILLGDW